MSKLSKLREAMKNPPQERLCLIAARGYILSIIGIFATMIFLFYYGIWYVSFAFIFAVIGHYVGYRREMGQYKNIIEAKKQMGVFQAPEDDPSFTRGRLRLIEEQFGKKVMYILLILIFGTIVFFSNFMTSVWYLRFGWVIIGMVFFFYFYLGPIYKVALANKKRRKNHGKDKRK